MATIGSSTAPSQNTINYDALLSLSLEYIRDTLVDNIFTSAPFLGALYGAFGKKRKTKKGVRMVNGGERIRVPLLYGKNTTVGSYSGYDTLDVTPQEGITTAFFTWRQLAGSIAISRKEERQNAGEGKIRDLLQSKLMQTELTLRDELNNQLIGKTVSSGVWSAGNGVMNQTANADFDPLLSFLAKDSTTGTVGNISRSSYSWWRPQIIDGSAVHGSKDSEADRGFNCDDWATLKAAMRYAYNAAGRGGGGMPDLILCDQLAYESYEGALDDKMRYSDPKGPASAGFESVRFKGADMVWDEMMPDVDGGYTYDSSSWNTSTMLFLNLTFMELVLDAATDFITTPFVRPENQDAKVAQILAMGNLTCSNLRKQAMIYGITGGIYA